MLSKTLIIFPLMAELRPVLDSLQNAGWQFRKELHNKQALFHTDKAPVCLAAGGHGKVQMALQCQSLIESYNFTSVIGSGCCGALIPDIKPLELYLTSRVIEHDYNEKFDATAKKPEFSPSEKLNSLIQEKLNLPTAIMASGDEDIIESARRLELQKQTGAQVVTWESAGLARACRQKNIPWAEVRMVSDLCTTESLAGFKNTLHQGMPRVAEALQKIFES